MTWGRDRDEVFSTRGSQVAVNCDQTITVTEGDQATTTITVRGFVLDHRPAYYRKMGQGLPPNAYSKGVFTVFRPVGFLRSRCGLTEPPVYFSISGFLMGQASDTAYLPDYAYLRQRSVNMMLLKVRDARAQLLSAFFQRKMIADMVVSTLSKLTSAVLAVRHGNLAGAARALGVRPKPGRPRGGSVPELWLSLNYGWLPLLSDIYNLVETLQEIDTNPVVKISAISKDKQDLTVNLTGDHWTAVSRRVSEGSCCAVSYWYVSDRDLLNATKLGMINPLTTAWDLLPWSFVVDWFYPIGNYLATLENLGISYLSGTTSLKVKASERIVQNFNSSGNPAYSDGTMTYGNKYFLLDRDLLSKPAYVPELKNPLSFPHVANALSLLAQAFRG